MILLLTWKLVSMRKIMAEDECTTNSDCGSPFGQVRTFCCQRYTWNSIRICQGKPCLGRYCFTDGDCGGYDECCMNNNCINNNNCLQCRSNHDCAFSEYCCKQGRYVNVCRRSCVGEICFADSDCSGPGEYCHADKKCAKYSNDWDQNILALPCWGIPLIVIGVLGILVIFGICLYCRYCKKTSRNETQNAADRDNTNMALEETNIHTTPLPASASNSTYSHLAHQIEYPSSYHNHSQILISQTDRDGYEVPDAPK